MCAVSLVIMAGIMYRTSTVSKLNDSNNKFTLCNTVAGAATEKVFARMAYDFQNYGLGQVTNNLGLYRTNIPTAADNAYWGQFIFSDGQGNSNCIFVDYVTNYAGALPSQYTNLSTVAAPIYRIVANAALADAPGVIGTSQEDVLLSLVPITTYAIFYNGPLEFTQTADMTIRGRTHANDIICVGTSSKLIFRNIVTSTKTISGPTRDGVTPTSWNQGTTFSAGYTTNVPSVMVAITMTNAHSIIDIPPDETTEPLTSAQAMVRLYNQAHIVILITNVVPTVGSIPAKTQISVSYRNSENGRLPARDSNPLPNPGPYLCTISNVVYVYTNTLKLDFYTNAAYGLGSFLSLTNTFTDRREYKTDMYVANIDIAAYATWLSTNATLATKFNSTAAATILYIADQRGVGEANKMAVVRLVNAAKLPSNGGRGFTVATPNPLYVKGNYNITADDIHFATEPDSTTNANTCVPAALLSDSITILSSSFTDSTSATATGNASARNTLNAAVITGNVPSTGTTTTTFSGGVQNLMRMLEDWNGDTNVMNTSIVVLWASKIATNQFRNPIGWTSPTPAPVNPYYKPPTRLWGFDPNFYDPAKQPPGVPTALVPIRFNWTQPPPGTH
jgi:hypothetical protein